MQKLEGKMATAGVKCVKYEPGWERHFMEF
jgi:hypothetical protein